MWHQHDGRRRRSIIPAQLPLKIYSQLKLRHSGLTSPRKPLYTIYGIKLQQASQTLHIQMQTCYGCSPNTSPKSAGFKMEHEKNGIKCALFVWESFRKPLPNLPSPARCAHWFTVGMKQKMLPFVLSWDWRRQGTAVETAVKCVIYWNCEAQPLDGALLPLCTIRWRKGTLLSVINYFFQSDWLLGFYI